MSSGSPPPTLREQDPSAPPQTLPSPWTLSVSDNDYFLETGPSKLYWL